MLFRRAFRYLAQVLLVTGAVALVTGGCSRQGEGERCDKRAAGDSDCDDGLICKSCAELAVGPVDRCCQRDGSYDDERCIPGAGAICTTTDLATGGRASTGSGGEGGDDAASGGTGATAGSGATGATGGTESGGGTGATAGEAGSAG
jgi:hypothetical protein